MQLAEIGMWLARILALALGVYIVAASVLAAIKTFILPRPAQVRTIRLTFAAVRTLFNWRGRHSVSYNDRDRVMALYAPTALFFVPIVLMVMMFLGFALIYWALSPLSVVESVKLSGSALFTLGSFTNDDPLLMVFEFGQALLGMIMVALLIAYLPTIYSAFNRRETQVQLLEVRAGTPPSAWEMLIRSHRNGELEQLREFWNDWQVWFAEVEESHTSLTALAFFRSPRPDLSWVTAAGVTLDAAALALSTLDITWEPRAAFCIRSGYLALRQIADFFGVEHNNDPKPDDPISIAREEYNSVCAQLAAAGVPLLADRDRAWRSFSGWRVNYDTVLIALAALTMAPYAPWSSDRSVAGARPAQSRWRA